MMAPFELKVRSSGVGSFGLQLSCGVEAVEIKSTWVEPIVIAGPVDAKRYVQLGEKVDENFVTADSIFLPTTTSPPNSKVDEALFQIRFPFDIELRTTFEIFKLLETLIKTPSVVPATFLPAKVSLLDPTTVKLPSPCRTTASEVVDIAPICKTLLKMPALSVLTKKPALPFSLPMIPTTEAPFRSTAIAVGNKTEDVGKVLVNARTPAAVTFQIVIALKSPTFVVGGTSALSGLRGVALGLGAINSCVKGVAPAIQISPTESTAAAVAIDAADWSKDKFHSSTPVVSIARAYALDALLPKTIRDLPEATTPLTSSGVPTVVSNCMGLTEIFFGAA